MIATCFFARGRALLMHRGVDEDVMFPVACRAGRIRLSTLPRDGGCNLLSFLRRHSLYTPTILFYLIEVKTVLSNHAMFHAIHITLCRTSALS
jgi:hypothetical protein